MQIRGLDPIALGMKIIKIIINYEIYRRVLVPEYYLQIPW